MVGRRIGVYEIVAEVGKGGIGEVYRATDTRLKRQVAIKILPEAVGGDPGRLARFQREAELLASLNHPNIAAIYSFEDSASTHALVMELVEGPTLADRIANVPIPLNEATAIAKQIADALQAAHERHIIHRDLKPANIKVKADGVVKVLDFGLAKALDPNTSVHADATSADRLSATITSPAVMTGAGIVLGTAAYMSPEQGTRARGRPAIGHLGLRRHPLRDAHPGVAALSSARRSRCPTSQRPDQVNVADIASTQPDILLQALPQDSRHGRRRRCPSGRSAATPCPTRWSQCSIASLTGEPSLR